MSVPMITFTIDGKTVSVPKGTLLVEAAKAAGIEIPVFCYHPKLDPAGVCRMCQVEIEGQRKPQTACTTLVADGMVVHTDTPRVAELRRGVLEFTLINHPLDCPVCDKGGECDLQDLTFAYGPPTSRYMESKEHKPKAVDLGQFIVLDEERCILCRRCVRFDEEIAQENNLIVAERGHYNVITTSSGGSYDSYFSGNTIELCPVGALTSDLYRFKARPWDLSKVPGICTGCSVGCNVRYDWRHGQLLRVISRENPEVDGGWICDRGRFNYTYVDGDTRLRTPFIRDAAGELQPAAWQDAVAQAAGALKAIKAQYGPAAIGIIGGGRLSLEEAYLLQKLGRVVLGTPNVDHRVSAQTVTSSAAFPGRLSDISAAGAVLVVDSLPAETAPVLDLRLRRAASRNKAKLITVGAALPAYRGRYPKIGVKPGETAGAIAVLTAAISGGKPAASKALADAQTALAAAGRVAIVWGGEDPAVGQALHALAAALGKPVSIHIPSAQPNSRGAAAMGMLPGYLPGGKHAEREKNAAEQTWRVGLPGAGLSTGAMLAAAAAGQIKALYLVGANLLGTFPDRALVQQALAACELVIVQELLPTETARAAHVVFPAAAFAEKSGSYANLDGLVQAGQPARKAVGSARADLQIIDALATALGTPLLRSARELEWEVKQVAGFELKAGALLPGEPEAALKAGPGLPVAAPTGEGDLLVVPVDRLFAGGGTARFDEAMQGHIQVAPQAILHPGDARRLGLSEGDGVRLGQGEAALDLTAHLSRLVVPGTVQVIKGLVSAPVNVLAAGAAVSVARRALEVAD